MDSYRSLVAWQQAHDVVLLVLRGTDTRGQLRTWALFDQLRRAAISIEANIVAGYALRGPMQFRRHLRIALGSAAEAECLLNLAQELEFLSSDIAVGIRAPLNRCIGALVGLVRTKPVEVSGKR